MCERKAVTPDISTTYWYLWRSIVSFLLLWKYCLTSRFLSFLILQSLGRSRLGLGEILSTLWRLQPVSLITWISVISWVTITRAQIWRYTPFTLTSTENFLSVYFRSSLQHNYKGFVCRWINIIIITSKNSLLWRYEVKGSLAELPTTSPPLPTSAPASKVLISIIVVQCTCHHFGSHQYHYLCHHLCYHNMNHRVVIEAVSASTTR